jgi:hypothetical protein
MGKEMPAAKTDRSPAVQSDCLTQGADRSPSGLQKVRLHPATEPAWLGPDDYDTGGSRVHPPKESMRSHCHRPCSVRFPHLIRTSMSRRKYPRCAYSIQDLGDDLLLMAEGKPEEPAESRWRRAGCTGAPPCRLVVERFLATQSGTQTGGAGRPVWPANAWIQPNFRKLASTYLTNPDWWHLTALRKRPPGFAWHVQ